MNIKEALDIANIALKRQYASVNKEVLETLVKSAQYDPEIRYVQAQERAIIHRLSDGTKVLLSR